jgi:hypothetical protein
MREGVAEGRSRDREGFGGLVKVPTYVLLQSERFPIME